MTLDGGNFQHWKNFSTLDPFTQTRLDHIKIKTFDFWKNLPTFDPLTFDPYGTRLNLEQMKNFEKIEKVKIDESFCTLVTIAGKFLEKKTLQKVVKKIDEIRYVFKQCSPTLQFQLVYMKSDFLFSNHMNRLPLAVFLLDDKGIKILL